MINETTTELPLTGIDGANPLAFLAALGTLHTLSTAWPDHDVRMGWTVSRGAWRPLLRIVPEATTDEVINVLATHLPRTDDLFPPELRADSEAAGPHSRDGIAKWKDKLRFPARIFADHAREIASAASQNSRTTLDFMAAWASDAVVERVDGIDVAQRTIFDFTSGQQSFIDLVDKLVRHVGPDDIRNALIGPWEYTPDPGISLRWDPIDEGRQYALHAIDPADGNKNPIVSVPGANLLAAAGLVYYSITPGKSGAEQPGIKRSGGSRMFRWPIWDTPVSSDTVRYLVAFEDVLADEPNWAKLRAIGISAIYQARIVMPSGRYRNFAAAEAL